MNDELGSFKNQEPIAPDSVPPPEDFAPTPPKELGPFQRWPQLFPGFAYPFFVAVIFAGFSLAHWQFTEDFFSASRETVFNRGEIWRLVTALFTHGDLAHIGLNLMPFLFFGWLLSSYFGPLLFLVSALSIGIVSNAITTWYYPPTTSLIGASGIVYGIIALWLVLYIRFDVENSPIKKYLRIIGFILMLLFPSSYDPNISYLAHGSGFAAGIVAGFIVAPYVRLRPPPPAAPRTQPKRGYIYARHYRIRKTNIIHQKSNGEQNDPL
jgi:membrane associated rhomboid family serine protease